ncbi:lipid A biosynthesis lauroyl/myristoyl acyltransferase [Candidatus Magnetoovum chiemensis]|nr:lipid A biosynthesis lauroyl/myristoyl acyltransferase [Candidatus Magnetoovum chiemensis]
MASIDRFKWLIEILIIITLTLPIAALPNSAALKLGDYIGITLFKLWRKRRQIAIDNIKNAKINTTDNPQTIAKNSFINLGRSFAEIIRIYYGQGQNIIESVEIDGIEHYNRAKTQNKGILVITGHCGNWELFSIIFAAKLGGGNLVARAFKNPYLNTLMEKIRLKYGNKIIYKTGAVKSILRELKNNQPVGVLMDQSVIEEEGVLIDFLGKKAWTSKMPALIAQKTGAIVLPCFIHRTEKGHKMVINKPVSLSAETDKEKTLMNNTILFTSHIENYIINNPAQWLWLHRRWKRT